MKTIVDKQTRSRHWWRFALLLLVVLPFVPELVIYAVAALAKAGGCLVDENWVCTIVDVRVSGIIATMSRIGILVARYMGEYGLAVVWLGACYLTMTRGWRSLVSRLLLAFAVTLIFALLPYVGPQQAIVDLHAGNCALNESGVGRCMTFGVDIGPSTRGVVNTNLTLVGFLIAVGSCAVYAIVAVIVRLGATLSRRGKRPTVEAKKTQPNML